MDHITKDAYEQSTTIYGYIRDAIDYYYDFLHQNNSNDKKFPLTTE